MAILTFLNCSFGYFTCDVFLTDSGNFCWPSCVVQGGNKVWLLNCKTSKVLLMLYSEPFISKTFKQICGQRVCLSQIFVLFEY